ncbi:Protein ASP-7 [Aphelenchoides avenae]|nr:Protein ASP-7 [Aphelenchus avenae]
MLAKQLSLCFLCLALSVVPTALGKGGGDSTRLLARRQKREAPSSGPKQPMVSVPLKLVGTGGNDLGYLVNVSVGTPAQHFQLTLDNWEFSTSTAAHVMAKNMTLEGTTCASVDIQRNLFDQSASTTFVADEYSDDFFGFKPDDSPYESPACTKYVEFDVGGDGFYDTWQIGSAIVKSVPAVQIRAHTPFNPEWKADGFLGLAPPDISEDLPYHTMDRFLNVFERPLLTLFFARAETTDATGNDNGGVMTLGGTDNVHCDSKWIGNFSDEDDACGWCFHLKSFSIGRRSYTRFNVSFPITKSAYIWAPRPVVDTVVKAIGAEYDFRSNRFLVSCDRRSSMPDMVFDVRALNYSLPATDYARRINPTDDKCTLMMKYTYPENPDFWLLGTTFFRPYCQQIDYSTNTFKLAKALH